MTRENPPSGEEPKKNMLKLLLRSKPAADVETPAGHIHLYPLRVRDMTDFGKLEPSDAVSQISLRNTHRSSSTQRWSLEPIRRYAPDGNTEL
jgi:hypothetical protein